MSEPVKIDLIFTTEIKYNHKVFERFITKLKTYTDQLPVINETLKVFVFDATLSFLGYISKINDGLKKESNFYFPTDFIDKDILYLFIIAPHTYVNLEQIQTLSRDALDVKASIVASQFYLHNSPDYFLLPPTRDWLGLKTVFHFNDVIINTGYYLVCDSVRKFESVRFAVSELLDNKKTLNHYARMILESFSSANALWQASYKSEPLTFILFLNLLRDFSIISAIDFSLGGLTQEIRNKIELIKQQLPYPLRSNFEWLMFTLFPRLGNDTLRNLALITDTVLDIVEETFTKMSSFTL